jgi:hypothetical protein
MKLNSSSVDFGSPPPRFRGLRRGGALLIALAAVAAAFAQDAASDDSTAALAKLSQRLPADWTPILKKSGDVLDSAAKKLAQAPDENLKGEVLRVLSASPLAEDFVLDHTFDGSVSGKELARVLFSFRAHPHWLTNARLASALEHAAAAEKDPAAFTEIVDTLQALSALRIRHLNQEQEDRLAGHTDPASQETLARLQAEDQDLGYVIDGIHLPAFLRPPPPVFTVKTAGPAIRVVAMGDFGTDGRDEHLVAAAMLAYQKTHPYDFGITLGDNFYFPMTSADDPHWDSVWQKLYGPLHVTFYPLFGNHDWGGDMPAAELLYTERSASWHFPAPCYTYVAGPVQFFVINPEYGNDGYAHLPAAQASWLKAELDRSTAPWKVVCGHFPLYQSTWNDDGLIATLMPVLKGRADFYLCGHVHNLQHHQPVDGVNFFVIGASGRGDVDVDASDPGTIWAQHTYGFGVLEADAHAFTVRILDETGAELHTATFHK